MDCGYGTVQVTAPSRRQHENAREAIDFCWLWEWRWASVYTPARRQMEALQAAYPTLSPKDITAAFERVALQVAAARRKQPDGWRATLVSSKSDAAQADARELWSAATEATRSSTRALLSQASASAATQGAAEAMRELQAAEVELREIAQLLASVPGGADAAAALLAAPSAAAECRAAAAPTTSRGDLAQQAASEVSRAEATAEDLVTQLASALQTRTRGR
jgi:hypothetical protein